MGVKKSELYVREFTDSDWDGFAGAEKFSNGKEPLFTGNDYFYAVGDANGITLWIGEGLALDNSWDLNFESPRPTQRLIRVIMESLPDRPTEELLKELGFNKELED